MHARTFFTQKEQLPVLFAILGNIDADLPALRCALDAIDDQGILTVVCSGNLVAGPGDPNPVIDLIRERRIPCAMGEEDRLMLRFTRKQRQLKERLPQEQWERLAAAHAAMNSANLEYLRNLHRLVRLEVDGVRIHVCHGSPSSTGETLSPESPFVRLQRHREDETPDILVCGGHASPWHREVDGTLFVGPGTVRESDATAGFVTVSTESTPWRVASHSAPCK